MLKNAYLPLSTYLQKLMPIQPRTSPPNICKPLQKTADVGALITARLLLRGGGSADRGRPRPEVRAAGRREEADRGGRRPREAAGSLGIAPGPVLCFSNSDFERIFLTAKFRTLTFFL